MIAQPTAQKLLIEQISRLKTRKYKHFCAFRRSQIMIKDERKNELLKLIEETGYVTVNRLAEQLYTSPSTIRRYLAELEQMGYVKRSYGGVELCGEVINTPVKLRFKKNHKEKDLIAQKAAERLQDNTVIFIDGSSTCLHMIPYLRRRQNIKIYTNGVEICSLLGEAGLSVYCLGGALLPRSMAFVGEDAINVARSAYFDDLFFSCGGFDNHTVTDYSESEAQLRRVLLQQSNHKYLLCDSSKVGKTFHYIICRDKDLTEIIS